jgi:hypothetical protein
MLKPPPCPVTDLALLEYINSLRRRIEVQLCQIETLADQTTQARNLRNKVIDTFYKNVRQMQADLQNIDVNPK